MSDPDGCWLWTGARGDKNYGHVWIGGGSGGMVKAHRVALRLTGVSVPDDMFVLHSCDNPPCVNPAHLRLGTNADNMRDMYARGRAPHKGAAGVVVPPATAGHPSSPPAAEPIR